MADSSSVLRIRQVRSKIGQTQKQREALRSLGLRRIGQVVERPDNAAVRGAVRIVEHLVRVGDDPVKGTAPAAAKKKTAKKATKKKAAKKKTSKASGKSAAATKTTKKKTKKKKASGGSS